MKKHYQQLSLGSKIVMYLDTLSFHKTNNHESLVCTVKGYLLLLLVDLPVVEGQFVVLEDVSIGMT